MIAGLDSATPPTKAQALAAKTAGIPMWNGYIETRPGVGLYHAWTQADFENARLCGSTPIAYCSGWDDPIALKAKASAWNVRLGLDVEDHIRPNGPWVPSWLNASGSGLYGNDPVHVGRTAVFHIRAAYPGSGDVRATWGGSYARPVGPCGWQWAGTHTEFGVGVDRGDYDDWFGGLHGGGGGNITGEDMDPELLAGMLYQEGLGRPPKGGEEAWLVKILTAGPVPNVSFIGATLGAVVNSTEGKAWAVKLAALRAGTLTGAPGATGPAGPGGPAGKDGAPGKDGVTPTTGTIAGPIAVSLEAK